MAHRKILEEEPMELQPEVTNIMKDVTGAGRSDILRVVQ